MPRSRGSELPQRQSPRISPALRTSSSNSDPTHHRPMTDRGPKVGGDRRSPRSGASDPLSQKKLGTRISGLETQLGQAQEELKILKDQLASAEAAKKEAQTQLEKKKKPTKKVPQYVENQDSNKHDDFNSHEVLDDKETDVFEVPVEKMNMELMEPKVEPSEPIDEDELKAKPVSEPTEPPTILEEDRPTFEDLALKNNEISSLKDEIIEKERKLEALSQENESLKSRLSEAALEISTVQTKETEMGSRLSQVSQKLEASEGNVAQLKEKLAAVEGAKEELENEMKKLGVQTEQWKKAADAAATVLAGAGEMNGRRLSERCGSMDKHFNGVFDPRVGGYAGFVGSPGLGNDLDDGFGGKRKSSGIRMFGDLWKKKGQK
ncbi:hypothetical protein LguiB_002754 [Lonicera macranthoides]